MFDPQALRIAQKTIDGELPARHLKFVREIERAKSRDGRNSVAMLDAVAEVCATELEARTDRFWRILHRAIIATGVEWTPDLAGH
jgi:hypothetical protein